MTKLAKFCRTHGISTSALAREAGVSRKHTTRVMQGRAEAGELVIARLTRAAERLVEEEVDPTDLFEFSVSRRRKVS